MISPAWNPVAQRVPRGSTSSIPTIGRRRWNEAMSGRHPFEIEHRMRSSDGAYRWFATRAAPMLDASGAVLGWLATATDIEGSKQAEDALRRLDERHCLALAAGHLGTWDFDPVGGRFTLDERARGLLGVAADRGSLSLEEILSCVHEDDRAEVRASFESALANDSDGAFDSEFRKAGGDDRVQWLHARGQVSFAGDAQALALSGVISDVTERRAGDEARLLVARELNHRVKNLFAIANGLVSMTARSAKSPKEMAEALRGRLGALSRAHELARPTFGADERAGHATTLGRLIASILEPYAQAGPDSRLSLDGPQVSLGANAVTSLGLVLHELATNAAKYGSLSQADGALTIGWGAQDGEVTIIWTEAGGPPVAEEPTARGFGSQLSTKSITGQLAGTLEHDWRPEGLQVRITLPLDRIAI